MQRVSFSIQTEQSFINLSRKLIQMNAYERMKFLNEHSDISRKEKANVIDTYISILEKIEDFETCESLFELKKALLKTPQVE